MSLALLPSPAGVDAFFGSQGLLELAEGPPERVSPDSEVVAAYGPDAYLGVCPAERYSPFFRAQPRHVARAMMLCPPFRSSLAAFKSTVLSGDFQFIPSVDATEDKPSDQEAKLSLQIYDECKRAAVAMDRSLESWAWEMLDACMEREKLAESVLLPVLGGPDAGKLALSRLAVKPHWSYRYGVDRQMNVRHIAAWSSGPDPGDPMEWRKLDPAHFTWYSWEPREGDPRGTSLADSTFHAFNLLMQLWPEFFAGNKKFGTPSLFLTTGEKSREMVTPRDARGAEIPGSRPVTQEFALAYQGSKLLNGGTIASSYGSTAKVIESTRDGVGMNSAIEVLEAQIIVCFLLQTRATREAQHGSKADSESGTGVLTTYAGFKRAGICQAARKPFFGMVAANYDEDVARRHTPRITLGKTDPRTFAAIAQAIGVLYQSGFFTEKQLHWLDAYMGLPQRRPGDTRVGPQKDNAPTTPGQTAPEIRAIARGISAELREMGMPA